MSTSFTRNRRAGANPAHRLHAASLIAGVLVALPALAGSSSEWLASTDGPSPMMGKLPYAALRDGTFAHPTLAESLNNLFMAMDNV